LFIFKKRVKHSLVAVDLLFRRSHTAIACVFIALCANVLQIYSYMLLIKQKEA